MAVPPMISLKEDHNDKCDCKSKKGWSCSTDSAKWPEPFNADALEDDSLCDNATISTTVECGPLWSMVSEGDGSWR